MDWQIPLLVSALVFAAFLIFRMRPAVTPSARASVADLGEARKRIEAAKEDADRAIALADAGDACAKLGRTNSAVGFYLRALRSDPRSTTIVERAAVGLARRPSALELLMWRHLAGRPWTGERRGAAIAGLRTLAGVYRKRRRHHARAEAIEHALEALGEDPPERSSSKREPPKSDRRT
jgi:tetratricopeptide (TPR) repeat protein